MDGKFRPFVNVKVALGHQTGRAAINLYILQKDVCLEEYIGIEFSDAHFIAVPATRPPSRL